MKPVMPEPAGRTQQYTSEGVPYSEPSGEYTEEQMHEYAEAYYKWKIALARSMGYC